MFQDYNNRRKLGSMRFDVSPSSREEIYNTYLQEIGGIRFTLREMDVIACVLHNRGEKKIASVLRISYRTVSSHVHNIKNKLGHSSRDGIIDLVERSGKLQYIRKYYLYLLMQAAFEKQLKKIGLASNRSGLDCFVSLAESSETNAQLLRYIEQDLKFANVTLVKDKKIQHKYSLHLIEDVESFIKTQRNTGWDIGILVGKNIDLSQIQNLKYINFAPEENYYYAILELLSKILDIPSSSQLIEEFKLEYETIKSAWESERITNEDPTVSAPNIVRASKLWKVTIVLFAVFSFGLLVSSIAGTSFITSSKILGSRNLNSDLPLPNQNILLDRESTLEEIDRKLSGKNDIETVVLVGVGGSGKTTTAYQYARNYGKKYSLIWEFNAETRSSFITSMKLVAYSISDTEEEKQELNSIIKIKDEEEKGRKLFELLKVKVKNYPNWLFIYNNLGSFKDIKDYYPYDEKIWGNGKVIITTRDSNIAYNNNISPENVIHIDALTPEDKLELFLKVANGCEECPKNDMIKINEFLDKIPPFPLDISLAANYIKEAKISYSEYLKELSEQKEDFLAIQEDLLSDMGEYNETRYDVVTLSIKQIVGADPEFRDLLLFISLIGSDNIPQYLLASYKEETMVSKFMHELKKFSLINEKSLATSTSSATFSIHRATQEIIKTYLLGLGTPAVNDIKLKDMSTVLADSMFNELKIPNSLRLRTIAYHAEMFFNHTHLINKNIFSKLDLQLGIFYFRIANYDKAKECLERALKSYERQYGRKDVETAVVLVRLGNLHRNIGDYWKSKKFLEEALEIYENKYGKGHIKTAGVYTYLASVYRNLGEYEKAKEILEEALLVYDKNYGWDNRETSRVLAYLGSTYQNMGNYIKAKELLEQALKVYKEYYGKDNAETAWISGRLGNLYHGLGYSNKAKELWEESFEIYTKHYGENCIGTAWAMSHLGSVYADLWDYKKAKELTQRSLDIYQNHFKPDHITFSWALFNLANVNQSQGNYEIAKDQLEQVLKVYEENYGKDHIQTAVVLNALGKNYLERNELDQGEVKFNEALKILQKDRHTDSYIILENLAELYAKKSAQFTKDGDSEKAQYFKNQSAKSLKEAFSIIENNFPEDSPHLKRLKLKAEQ